MIIKIATIDTFAVFFSKKQHHWSHHFSFPLAIRLHYELFPKLHQKPCQQFRIVLDPVKKQQIRNRHLYLFYIKGTSTGWQKRGMLREKGCPTHLETKMKPN